MVNLKICGITNLDDAVVATEAGADALGFVFYKKSKRYIEPLKAREVIDRLPPFVSTVGVFVNESIPDLIEVQRIAGFDIFQLHGDETAEFCSNLGRPYIKAIRVDNKLDSQFINSFNTSYLLFDTFSDIEYGGSGKKFNWELLDNIRLDDKFVILSGGLNISNVKKAIKKTNPYAVDVSSGVEKSPGIKDHKKLKAFAEAVKNEPQI